MNIFRKIIKYCTFFYLLFFLKSMAFSTENIKFVETTGRAYIENEQSISIARRMALEDAIYIAAMTGGAKINGFSSIDKETIISDYFTVEAESTLLDFDITKEEIIDNFENDDELPTPQIVEPELLNYYFKESMSIYKELAQKVKFMG